MPDQLYPELFIAVQTSGIFPDSKTFVDASAKMETDIINQNFDKEKDLDGFDLRQFVLKHFTLPVHLDNPFNPDLKDSAEQHLDKLWSHLTRQADNRIEGSTLISLPHPYIVPGGRFGEIYYWDSYFTMLGLNASGKFEMIENMVKNFAHLIAKVGHIPNGNRTYFISRSQPPYFSLMVELLTQFKGEQVWIDYLPALVKEYTFWMAGHESLMHQESAKRVVRSGDHVLNRYWDDHPIPRQESYIEDVELAHNLDDKAKRKLYRDIRGACESGWDFSTRWFDDGKNLSSICTTDIIPIDLNALLYHLEISIAKGYELTGEHQLSTRFLAKARSRKEAMEDLLWDMETGIYQDYNFVKKSFTAIPSLAMLFPLFFSFTDQDKADRVLDYVHTHLFKPGGLICTKNHSGQQWDAPNGWAPLQWIGFKAMLNYNRADMAKSLLKRWIGLNESVFAQSRKFVEKYNVVALQLEAGGGEYPLQDGFGWTNGVYLAMKQAQSQIPAD